MDFSGFDQLLSAKFITSIQVGAGAGTGYRSYSKAVLPPSPCSTCQFVPSAVAASTLVPAAAAVVAETPVVLPPSSVLPLRRVSAVPVGAGRAWLLQLVFAVVAQSVVVGSDGACSLRPPSLVVASLFGHCTPASRPVSFDLLATFAQQVRLQCVASLYREPSFDLLPACLCVSGWPLLFWVSSSLGF
jgi:hypothetical protein